VSLSRATLSSYLAFGILQEGQSKALNASCKDEIFNCKRRRHMARPAKDDEREERIQMEIIVDAYGPEEQALGWY
jgi:hypothetical protein